MKHLWSDTEVATLITLFKQGRSIPEISEAIGRSRIAVSIKESKLRDRGVIGYRYPLICTVEGCTDRHRSMGFCYVHYKRERRRMGYKNA